MRAGWTLDQLKTNLHFGKYANWGMYKQWAPLNIEGIYQRVVLQRRAR